MNSLDKLADDQASIDAVRDYWNQRPCNIRHSQKPVGTKDYFDEVEARKYLVEPHIPKFAEFPLWNGKKVLEVGCGIGTDATNFARGGADYTGADLSQASLDIAAARFNLFGLNGRFLSCNAEQLSSHLPQASYDLIYSFGVIHHTPDQRAVVEEIRKLIRPDGQFRFMLYARNSWKDVMIEAGLDQPEAQFGCPIATTYTPEMLENLVKGLFKLEDVRQAHIFPYIVEKYVKYEYEPQPWFKAMPQKMFEALEHRFGWHMLIKATPI